MRTTKEERAGWLQAARWASGASGDMKRLCRDVDALEGALGEITLEFAALIVATDMTLGMPGKPSEGRDHAHGVLARAQAVLTPNDGGT